MGHLIPMNLQLNAEVGDKGVEKGDIVPAPERRTAGALGRWPASNMNGLQCPWGGWGGQGGCHLALYPALLDPATKASLIPVRLLLGGEAGVGRGSTPSWPLPRSLSKELPLVSGAV